MSQINDILIIERKGYVTVFNNIIKDVCSYIFPIMKKWMKNEIFKNSFKEQNMNEKEAVKRKTYDRNTLSNNGINFIDDLTFMFEFNDNESYGSFKKGLVDYTDDGTKLKNVIIRINLKPFLVEGNLEKELPVTLQHELTHVYEHYNRWKANKHNSELSKAYHRISNKDFKSLIYALNTHEINAAVSELYEYLEQQKPTAKNIDSVIKKSYCYYETYMNLLLYIDKIKDNEDGLAEQAYYYAQKYYYTEDTKDLEDEKKRIKLLGEVLPPVNKNTFEKYQKRLVWKMEDMANKLYNKIQRIKKDYLERHWVRAKVKFM